MDFTGTENDIKTRCEMFAFQELIVKIQCKLRISKIISLVQEKHRKNLSSLLSVRTCARIVTARELYTLNSCFD